MKTEKYKGIIPAFYACYDENGEVSTSRTRALARLMVDKGAAGLYVGGSSGECIYLGVEERKRTLEAVMQEVKGECVIIAHVACNNTKDSMELAAHAQSLGVDAIAAIPPIYFRLPEHAVAKYWNDISSAASDTDFIIYNIPQLAGTQLTASLLKEMMKNKNVVGVKNSSMPTMDIMSFKAIMGEDKLVFNGPDEQLISGLAAGADGGIGGTYGAMLELYLEIYNCFNKGDMARAQAIQKDCLDLIAALCSCKGSMYAVIKRVLKIREGIDLGGVRLPMASVFPEDEEKIVQIAEKIDKVYKKYF